MLIRFIPYVLLVLISLMMRASGLIMVVADLSMLLVPVVYLWKRQSLQVFNVSGLLILPVYLSVWSVNTAVYFIIRNYPGMDVARIGALGFLILALLAVTLTRDAGKLNGMKKETLSLNLFLYFLLGLGLITRWW